MIFASLDTEREWRSAVCEAFNGNRFESVIADDQAVYSHWQLGMYSIPLATWNPPHHFAGSLSFYCICPLSPSPNKSTTSFSFVSLPHSYLLYSISSKPSSLGDNHPSSWNDVLNDQEIKPKKGAPLSLLVISIGTLSSYPSAPLTILAPLYHSFWTDKMNKPHNTSFRFLSTPKTHPIEIKQVPIM